MTREEHIAEAERLLAELEPRTDERGTTFSYIVGGSEYGNRVLKAHTHALLAQLKEAS